MPIQTAASEYKRTSAPRLCLFWDRPAAAFEWVGCRTDAAAGPDADGA